MTPTDPPARTFTETARRAQIIAAAIDTVNEIGYHRASLAEIAVRAEVAKSAIVYYFSSKEALLLSIVDEVFTGLHEAIAPAVLAQTDPAAQLRTYAREYLAHVDAHRAEVTAGIEIVVSHRTEDGTPLYLTGTEEDSRLLRDILTAGMDAGVFRRMPLHFAVGIVEALLDVWTTDLQRDLNAELDVLGEQTIVFLLQGLAPTPGTSSAARSA
ncbi:TetR/AcrR family transcriptional regulator [Agrococcus baldri]|uniref:TetR family transcriptional regulator n=1 Tax=Agrococcus baldri TaxID=153730 RepID=A0AA87US60_9MICO|nr:TetR/AcrR family transcriptional regulator [Agrococcus baldri]GEK80324.1 TetR family transcriptional regulator [Agrococcus baldri]